jgi:hypothetical protein
MTTAKKIRAGDAVLHRPSGERWLVAAVNDQGDLYCAGWPCTRASIEDCDLVEATSDERHFEMVFACARIRESDPRRSYSLQLCTLMMGRGERVPPDIAQQVLGIIESNLQQARTCIDVAARCTFDATSLCSPRSLPAWAKPADVQLQLARLSDLSLGIRDASMRLLGCFDRATSPHTRLERPAPPTPPAPPIPDMVLKS